MDSIPIIIIAAYIAGILIGLFLKGYTGGDIEYEVIVIWPFSLLVVLLYLILRPMIAKLGIIEELGAALKEKCKSKTQ